MIVTNERESALECTLCGELDGVSAAALTNPAALMLLTERMRREHAGCDKWAGNPARAKAERAYALRLRAEMRGYTVQS